MMSSSFGKGYGCASDIADLRMMADVLRDQYAYHCWHPERDRSGILRFNELMNSLVNDLGEGLPESIQEDSEQVLLDIHQAIDQGDLQEVQKYLSGLDDFIKSKMT